MNGESEDGDGEMDVEIPRRVAKALGKASKVTVSGTKFDDITDGLRELDMEHYDDEEDGIDPFSSGLGDLYYPSNDMDPYLKDKDDDEESEDSDDMTINPTDSVIVCARNEDDIWLYVESEDGESNVYVHHDVIISSFPFAQHGLIVLSKVETKIDEVQPCVVLAASIKYKEGSHRDSVLGLAWNKFYRNVLASASADKQVQAVAWNHFAHQVLLSGSFDHSVVLKDGRASSHSGYKWTVTADVESLAWDPHTEHSFVVSLEDGTVKGFDIRAATSSSTSESKPSFTLHAHDKAVCAISYNPSAPNLLATGSTDKMVKLWDVSNNQPSCISSRNPKAGAVFSVSFSEDNPFLLAIGGSKGTLEVWDTSYDAAVAQRFGSYIKKSRTTPGS
ncbi:Transducin/WD40 repeat-like superfamily protein [Prunus dulcis]|uniref:Transducin/WD40 repeat-like superfamily protein n=1 Tax=Prunus dulcis TaxID=3755 RepID=A0A4Y1RW31_PRUDU|nr:Transducin/WD40 repeat-like superfamily protein [Prunus dulcis]